MTSRPSTLAILQSVSIVQDPDGRVHFTADADIDADGSPHAYNRESRLGLDDLKNAGYAGHWCGIVTDRAGAPFVQTNIDPAPGFYVSSTSYQDPEFQRNDPRRYLDSEKVPFIVVEDFIRRRAKGVVLGCRARVTNLRTKQSIDAVVGDLGPLYKIGELSIAAARSIGINADPRKGGQDGGVLYELWPGEHAILNGVKYGLIPMVKGVAA